MKKIISLMLILALMTSLSLFSANADVSGTTEKTPAAMYGDLDGDENITSSDALFILRMSVQLEKITPESVKLKNKKARKADYKPKSKQQIRIVNAPKRCRKTGRNAHLMV